MAGKEWTTSEQRQLAELIDRGMSATDASKRLNRSNASLYQKAKELGLKFHGQKAPNQKLPSAIRPLIRQQFADGMSREEILSRYPISRNYLNAIIRGDK